MNPTVFGRNASSGVCKSVNMSCAISSLAVRWLYVSPLRRPLPLLGDVVVGLPLPCGKRVLAEQQALVRFTARSNTPARHSDSALCRDGLSLVVLSPHCFIICQPIPFAQACYNPRSLFPQQPYDLPDAPPQRFAVPGQLQLRRDRRRRHRLGRILQQSQASDQLTSRGQACHTNVPRG